MRSFSLGISAAASWAWGTSLIVGMQIAQHKGISAWFIWAGANSLTLVLFGELMRRGLLGRAVFDLAPIKYAALLIQCFCLVIQLNIIFEVLTDLGLAASISYVVTSTIGIIFTLWMYRHGLITSIKTDVVQWLITLLAILGIIAIGGFSGTPYRVFPPSTGDDILWGLWSACILLSGPIGDVQHWQRAEVAGRGRAYLLAGAFFALYMVLILCMAQFKFTMAMNFVLLLAVLCVTTSTIDSIAVALHELGGKKTGTFVALGICLAWGLFVQIGVITLWSYAGIFRVAFAGAILWLAMRQGSGSLNFSNG